MRIKIIRLIEFVIIAGLFSNSLVAQIRVENVVEVKFLQVENIELRSVNNEVQLRAENKVWPEYIIIYTPLGEMNSKTAYEYDDTGNLVLHTSYKLENDAWVNDRKYTYEYDAMGNETLFESAKWENNGWVNEFKVVTEYGEGGLGSMRYEYTWDGKDWVFENESAFFNANRKVCYDVEDDEITFGYPLGDGNWASFHTFSMEGNATYMTKNDANGNLILFEHKDENGNGYVYNIKYDNDKPTLIERSYNNSAINYKVEYKYDKEGNCTSCEDFY